MRPEWGWQGSPEHEAGSATYTVRDTSLIVALTNFREAAGIADLVYRAYREGQRDGIEHARTRVKLALASISEQTL